MHDNTGAANKPKRASKWASTTRVAGAIIVASALTAAVICFQSSESSDNRTSVISLDAAVTPAGPSLRPTVGTGVNGQPMTASVAVACSSAGAMCPTFLLIGERKCGTSSLFHYLLQHPQVARSPVISLSTLLAPTSVVVCGLWLKSLFKV